MFYPERDAPITPAGFRKTLARIGEARPLAFLVHPHMLRHTCGLILANEVQDTRALKHLRDQPTESLYLLSMRQAGLRPLHRRAPSQQCRAVDLKGCRLGSSEGKGVRTRSGPGTVDLAHCFSMRMTRAEKGCSPSLPLLVASAKVPRAG